MGVAIMMYYVIRILLGLLLSGVILQFLGFSVSREGWKLTFDQKKRRPRRRVDLGLSAEATELSQESLRHDYNNAGGWFASIMGGIVFVVVCVHFLAWSRFKTRGRKTNADD